MFVKSAQNNIDLITSHTCDVLAYVKPFLPLNPVVVEAGAFNGSDTVQMSNFWPQGVMHAFEPVPQLFEQLAAKTACAPNIFCYPYALSNNSGSALFHVAEKPQKPGIPSQAGSLLKPKERLALSPMIFKDTITVPTITLNDWAKKYAVGPIDFIWLDVQGAELSILQAAQHILDHVKVIYTEVEFVEAYEGQPLYYDVFEWLTGQGFVLKACDFTDQSTWFFGNVVFVKNI